MYTNDAILLPAGEARVEGREDIEAFWAKTLSGSIEDVRLTTENLVPLGEDLVYEIGSYTTTAPVSGHYLVLWKRVDGAWKLHVDIFNQGGKSQ
jgi:ketosteroid isomerase-like protein